MITGKRDTIAAIATPAGTGGVGIVRLSGARAEEILRVLLGRVGDELPERVLFRGTVRDCQGNRVDDVLSVVMRAPRSYTGEHVAELHGHGGSVNMARLLRAALDEGARLAEAGEFTRRAFEYGKLDLTRAEAIADVIAAGTERAWRVAQAQLEGALGDAVRSLRVRATELLAEVEACIDFPEQDAEFMASAMVARRAEGLARETSSLASTFVVGRALREGIDVVIVGPVNAGKSSLFNRLVGSERAIVDPSPGTTRDFVEERIEWQGVPVTLIDTAGERAATTAIERRGIELGRQRAARADLRVVVHEAAGAPRKVSSSSAREIHVITKGDLLPAAFATKLMVTSAQESTGLDALRDEIVAVATGRTVEQDDGVVVSTERQRALLGRATIALERAAKGASARQHTELVAVDLRDGAERLAEVLGERVGEEMLDALFAKFCIGK